MYTDIFKVLKFGGEMPESSSVPPNYYVNLERREETATHLHLMLCSNATKYDNNANHFLVYFRRISGHCPSI